jgi:hypothetical protein
MLVLPLTDAPDAATLPDLGGVLGLVLARAPPPLAEIAWLSANATITFGSTRMLLIALSRSSQLVDWWGQPTRSRPL